MWDSRRIEESASTHPSLPRPERAAVFDGLGGDDAQHGGDALLWGEDTLHVPAEVVVGHVAVGGIWLAWWIGCGCMLGGTGA